MSNSDIVLLRNWLNTTFDIPAEFELTLNSIRVLIKDQIAELIETDLSKLYNLLYRIDIDEDLLKSKLKDSEMADSAEIITDMIIERQLEKIKSRKDHS